MTGSETDAVMWDAEQTVIVTGEVDDDFLSNMVIFTHAVTEGTYAAANRTVTVTATDTATPSIVLGNVQPGATETDPNMLFARRRRHPLRVHGCALAPAHQPGAHRHAQPARGQADAQHLPP